MPTDLVERLLAADFAANRAALENDGFAARVIGRVGAKRRKRLALIGAAGGAGAFVAVTQFDAVAGLFEPLAPYFTQAASAAETANFVVSFGPQLLAAAAIAVAFAATGFVMQGER